MGCGIARGVAVYADRRTTTGDGRNCRRFTRFAPDAGDVARRCRQRQNAGRRIRLSRRSKKRTAGGIDGADRNFGISTLRNIIGIFSYFGVQCELFVGGIRGAKRREALAQLRLGLSHIAIGTHALFYEEKNMPPVALAVIDEQHRFGGRTTRRIIGGGQYASIDDVGDSDSAYFGNECVRDVDISVLDELPPDECR